MSREEKPETEPAELPNAHKDSDTRIGERTFRGIPGRVVRFCLALISALVIYWTMDVTGDVVIKRALYLMITLGMCAVVFPFSRKSSLQKISALVDALIVVLTVLGSLYVMYDYNARFVRLSDPSPLITIEDPLPGPGERPADRPRVHAQQVFALSDVCLY